MHKLVGLHDTVGGLLGLDGIPRGCAILSHINWPQMTINVHALNNYRISGHLEHGRACMLGTLHLREEPRANTFREGAWMGTAQHMSDRIDINPHCCCPKAAPTAHSATEATQPKASRPPCMPKPQGTLWSVLLCHCGPRCSCGTCPAQVVTAPTSLPTACMFDSKVPTTSGIS
jgi:hypothetical protein